MKQLLTPCGKYVYNIDNFGLDLQRNPLDHLTAGSDEISSRRSVSFLKAAYALFALLFGFSDCEFMKLVIQASNLVERIERESSLTVY